MSKVECPFCGETECNGWSCADRERGQRKHNMIAVEGRGWICDDCGWKPLDTDRACVEPVASQREPDEPCAMCGRLPCQCDEPDEVEPLGRCEAVYEATADRCGQTKGHEGCHTLLMESRWESKPSTLHETIRKEYTKVAIREPDEVERAFDETYPKIRDIVSDEARCSLRAGFGAGYTLGLQRGQREATERAAPFVKFYRGMCDHFWTEESLDMDGGEFQDIGVRCGLMEELPAKTQAERDEWGEDATMFYNTEAAAIRRGEDGE